MKEFSSIKELREDNELRNMGRNEYQKVKVNGEEVFTCATNQQYEDIIWSGINNSIVSLLSHFGIQECECMDIVTDLSSTARDMILKRLGEENILKIVDVFENY